MNPPLDHQEQAALLARWLEEHPGSPAPEGLDPEVLEAVYALRPDLAPAPSFSIDDILAGVTCGPFVIAPETPVEGPHTEEPVDGSVEDLAVQDGPAVPEAPAPVVELAAARPRRRTWLLPAAGALAAAAMALIVVSPFLKHGLPSLGSPEPAMTAAPSLDADLIAEVSEPLAAHSSPEPDPRRAPVAESTPAPDAQPFAPEKPADGPASRGAYYLEAPPAADAGVSSGDRVTAAKAASTSATTAEMSEATVSGRSGGFARQERGQPTATTPVAAEPLGGWAGASTTRGPAAAPAAPAAPPPAQPRFSAVSGGATPAAASSDLGDDEFLVEEEAGAADFSRDDDLDHAEATSAHTGREERKRAEEEDVDDAGASRAASARRATPAPKAAGRPTGWQTGERASEASPAEQAAPAPALADAPDDGVDALRSQANPLDYRSDWYQRDPSLDAATRALIAAAYAKAQSAIVAGDVAGAMAALSSLLASPNPVVVQDAAFRLATLQLQGGQLETADATVRRGLAASGSPTVYRSRLLALQGSILEESGRPAEAVESYREAVDDNDARQ